MLIKRISAANTKNLTYVTWVERLNVYTRIFFLKSQTIIVFIFILHLMFTYLKRRWQETNFSP